MYQLYNIQHAYYSYTRISIIHDNKQMTERKCIYYSLVKGIQIKKKVNKLQSDFIHRIVNCDAAAYSG